VLVSPDYEKDTIATCPCQIVSRTDLTSPDSVLTGLRLPFNWLNFRIGPPIRFRELAVDMEASQVYIVTDR